MSVRLRRNSSEYYIYDLYKKKNNKESALVRDLIDKSGLKVGRAYGNTQINILECFSDTGDENLRYKNVGYGGVNFMGIAIHYPSLKMNDLFYRSIEIKEAVEVYIISMQDLFEQTSKTINLIKKQHGEPKVQYAILAYMAGS